MSKTLRDRPAAHQAVQERQGLRASGAAGLHHDRRDRRARTRGDALRRSLRDQGRVV